MATRTRVLSYSGRRAELTCNSGISNYPWTEEMKTARESVEKQRLVIEMSRNRGEKPVR